MWDDTEGWSELADQPIEDTWQGNPYEEVPSFQGRESTPIGDPLQGVQTWPGLIPMMLGAQPKQFDPANPPPIGMGALTSRNFPEFGQTILRWSRDPATVLDSPDVIATVARNPMERGIADIGSLYRPALERASLQGGPKPQGFSMADAKLMGSEIVEWLRAHGFDRLKFAPALGEFAGKTSNAAARQRLFEHGLGLGKGDKIGMDYYYNLNPYK